MLASLIQVAAPTNVTAVAGPGVVTFTWDSITDPNFGKVEIFADDNDVFSEATKVGETFSRDGGVTVGMQPYTGPYFWFRCISKQGTEGPWTTSSVRAFPYGPFEERFSELGTMPTLTNWDQDYEVTVGSLASVTSFSPFTVDRRDGAGGPAIITASLVGESLSDPSLETSGSMSLYAKLVAWDDTQDVQHWASEKLIVRFKYIGSVLVPMYFPFVGQWLVGASGYERDYSLHLYLKKSRTPSSGWDWANFGVRGWINLRRKQTGGDYWGY